MSVAAMLCILMGGLTVPITCVGRSGNCVRVCSLPSFIVKNCLQRCIGFSGAGSIWKMLEDVSLVSVGITSGSLAEENNVIAVDTRTFAVSNFKSVSPALCAVS